LYFIKNSSILDNIYLRGYNLTKKLNKNQKKGSLVFLRAPKHFNIGKRKIYSFKNYSSFLYKLKIKFPLKSFLNNPSTFIFMLSEFHKFHLLYKLSSIKVTLKIKLKF
jgi:hypothetical protein